MGIWPKPQISLIVKKNLEIGLNNKQNNVVGRDLGQNVLCNCDNFQNGFIGPKDMSKNQILSTLDESWKRDEILLKIKNGYQNAVYAGLMNELDAKLKRLYAS